MAGDILIRLTDVKDKELSWVQTSSLETQLKSKDGSAVASLRWVKRWGSLAIGTTAEGSWTLKRAGFLRPKITVRRRESEENVATMAMRWLGGGVVDFTSDGQRYSFRRSSIRKSEWTLNHEGKKILTTTPQFGHKKLGAAVRLQDSSSISPENHLSLLTIIMWYAILLMAYEGDGTSEAALGAAVATSV